MWRWKTQDYRTASSLLCAVLGMALFASPWIYDELSDPAVLWSAVFGGALVIRLGLSAALRFREWKAWIKIAVGFWLALAPCLLRLERAPPVAEIHHLVGLAVVALALAELWLSRGAPHVTDAAPRRRSQESRVVPLG